MNMENLTMEIVKKSKSHTLVCFFSSTIESFEKAIYKL
jgi:hypothetical protein